MDNKFSFWRDRRSCGRYTYNHLIGTACSSMLSDIYIILSKSEGFQGIMEIYGELITEKLSLLKHLPSTRLQQQTKAITSCKEQPSAALLSSFSEFGDDIVMTDTGKTSEILPVFISMHQLICISLHMKLARGC